MSTSGELSNFTRELAKGLSFDDDYDSMVGDLKGDLGDFKLLVNFLFIYAKEMSFISSLVYFYSIETSF